MPTISGLQIISFNQDCDCLVWPFVFFRMILPCIFEIPGILNEKLSISIEKLPAFPIKNFVFRTVNLKY